MDSRITNARPREISISICFHLLKADNVCFLRDLKYALFFSINCRMVGAVFRLFCYIHSLQK